MINSFSQFLIEEEKEVYFTFGRMNPPTIGHGKLLDKLGSKSGRIPYKVFLSQSEDKKKNPLSYSDKVKHVRKMFPKHARNVMIDKKVKTAIDALVKLHNDGYKKVNMIVGSDRVNEFEILFNKYNGVKGRHGLYNFKNINVVSAGDRDPDAEGASGSSATKQRAAAADNDYTSFSQGLPSGMSNGDAKKLFNDVRKGMGLKEEMRFRNHVQLEKVSDTREEFVNGKLFELGEEVVVKDTDEVGKLTFLGANYVIVEMSDGKRLRKWLDDVARVDEDHCRADYGTDQSTKIAKKMTPGETNEKNVHMDVVKKKIEGEKKRDAIKHARMKNAAIDKHAKEKKAKNRPTMGRMEQTFNQFLQRAK